MEEQYKIEKIDSRIIYNFIFNCRRIISFHIRNIYNLERLAPKYSNHKLGVDESLFTHKEGEQTWVVGLINTDNNKLD